jgi:tRNA-modifying protein YgfZ
MCLAAQQALHGSIAPDQQDPVPLMIALSSYSVVEVKGADALAYLQAQTMNDVAALGDGQWQWNGLLNPKGRVLFLMLLLRHDAGRFWLLQPVPRGDELVAHLARFRFRSKVALEARHDLACLGVRAAEAGIAPPPAQGSAVIERGLVINLAPSCSGSILVTDQAAADAADDPIDWHAASLRAGIPRIGEAVSAAFTPQMLALERISAYSIRKGCYPGQEIVARTHFLGQAKRRMQLLASESEAQPGQALTASDGRSLGQVVDCTPTHDGFLLLCVLNEELAAGELLDTSCGALRALDWG